MKKVEKKEKFTREFVTKNKDLTLQKSFTFELNKILKKNKVILIYPIPEVGWRVPDKIMSNNIKKLISGTKYKDVTTSYEVYRKRTLSSFELLDELEHKNLIRFYPHKIFVKNHDVLLMIIIIFITKMMIIFLNMVQNC